MLQVFIFDANKAHVRTATAPLNSSSPERATLRSYCLLAVLATFVAVNLVLNGGELVNGSPGASVFDVESVDALLDVDVAHVAPVLTPRVTDDPVFLLGGSISVPANNTDDMVNTVTGKGGDTSGVIQDGSSIDTARDGAVEGDFLGHGVSTRQGAVLRDGDGGVLGNGYALALGREGGAGTSNVLGLASPVTVGADAFLGLRRASHVRVGGFVTDAHTSLGGDLLQPLVRTSNRATMAGAHIGTVKDVLHRGVDVNSSCVARNLNAISEGRDGAVSPAGATV